MNLKDRISNDIVNAMKNKNKELLQVLRSVKGAMQLESINNKKELKDEVIIDVISKQIKMRKESILEFNKANRTDLATSYQNEIDILQKYLPEQLSIDEVNKVINDTFQKIKPTSIKDLGNIMREVTPLLKGKFDMSQASAIIKEKINNL